MDTLEDFFGLEDFFDEDACEADRWILENVEVVGETEKGWRVRVDAGGGRAHITWFPKTHCGFDISDGKTRMHLTTWIYNQKLPEAPWLRDLAKNSRSEIGY